MRGMINQAYFTLLSTPWSFNIAVKIRDELNRVIAERKSSLEEEAEQEPLKTRDKKILEVIAMNEERHQESKERFTSLEYEGKFERNYGTGPIYITPISPNIVADGTDIARIEESIRDTKAYMVSIFDPPIEMQRGLKNIPDGEQIDIKSGWAWKTLEYGDACRVASVYTLRGLFPKLKGTRQEKTKGRESNMSRVFAKTMQQWYDGILTFDIHNEAIAVAYPGDFLEPIYGSPIFEQYLLEGISNGKIRLDAFSSTDEGSVKRAAYHAKKMASKELSPSIIICLKRRIWTAKGQIEGMEVVGDVKGKYVAATEDIIGSGGTIKKWGYEMFERGAEGLIIIATHGLFNDPAFESLDKLAEIFKEKLFLVVVGDTVNHGQLPPYVVQLSLYNLYARAALGIHFGDSISDLYGKLPELNPRLG